MSVGCGNITFARVTREESQMIKINSLVKFCLLEVSASNRSDINIVLFKDTRGLEFAKICLSNNCDWKPKEAVTKYK